MIYGYCRVSSRGQEKNGNSMEQQEKTLREHGATEIIKEQFTGATTKRPQFDKLTDKLKKGDSLVITKLDRFARTTREGLSKVDELLEKGVTVNILNMGIMDSTATGILTRTIFLAFAQYELDMIIERTQTGKAIARTKPGFKEGRPKSFTPKQIDNAIKMLQDNSYTEVVAITNISKSTLIREMKKRGLNKIDLIKN